MANGNDKIRIYVEDHTGNNRREAKIAANADVGRIKGSLISALKLPITDPAGKQVVYNLADADQQALQPGDTLESAGVRDGDTLTLVPAMTAGGGS